MAVTLQTPNRVHGLDVARAVAMVAMLVAHYVEADSGSGIGAVARSFVDGRALPLFMVLGGVGISFLTRRSPAPDRDLLARAAILFPMGLVLQEYTVNIAIILQYYALFFVMATVLRRLPGWGLLLTSVVLVGAGAYSKQVLAPELTSYGGWDGIATLFDPGLWWSLVVTGYYPFLPAGAFLTLGMWLGRRNLGSTRIALPLIVTGVLLAFLGSWVGAWAADQVDTSGVTVDEHTGRATLTEDLLARYADREALTVPQARARLAERFPRTGAGMAGLLQVADSVERTTPGFRWERLFDAEGHSQMPAWMIGSTGSSLAVIGLSLVAASLARLTLLSILGEMALTFYTYQAIAIIWTPPRFETSLGDEYLLILLLLAGFSAFALVWRFWFRRGPLEMVLRIGSAPRRAPEGDLRSRAS